MNSSCESIDSYRKRLTRLRAQVRDGVPHIRMRLTTPVFNATKGQCREMSIRVYRREMPGFVFGEDYDEYFHGLRPDPAETIFAGTMPTINGRQFEYRDERAESGCTYAYWVSTDQGDTPIGPIAIKPRDPRVWWPYAVVRERMQTLAARHPSMAQCQIYGHTVRGMEIAGITIGRGPRTLALVGTLHAGESGPELIVPALERLADEQPELLDTTGIAAVPVVNIDERNRIVAGTPWYLRKNANGVDINRNFDADWKDEECCYGQSNLDARSNTYRGQAPASEPETRAVTAFLEQIRPRSVFSYHCLPEDDAGTLFFPTRHAVGDQAYTSTCQELASLFSSRFSGREMAPEQNRYESASGSLPHWVYAKLRVPAFDMECFLPPGRNSFDVLRRDDVDAACVGRYVQRSVTAIEEVLRKLA